MGCALRTEFRGAAYHVTAQANGRQVILFDDKGPPAFSRRNAATWEARIEQGYALSVVGEFLRLGYTAISREMRGEVSWQGKTV